MAGFSCGTTEIQSRLLNKFLVFHSEFRKRKHSIEVSEAFRDLEDLAYFCQNVSVALGTSLQDLANSLFIQMGNFDLV